jgi:hypothetical protein
MVGYKEPWGGEESEKKLIEECSLHVERSRAHMLWMGGRVTRTTSEAETCLSTVQSPEERNTKTQ